MLSVEKFDVIYIVSLRNLTVNNTADVTDVSVLCAKSFYMVVMTLTKIRLTLSSRPSNFTLC